MPPKDQQSRLPVSKYPLQHTTQLAEISTKTTMDVKDNIHKFSSVSFSMNENEINTNGSYHPDDSIPKFPPSRDESIVYNQHIKMFLRIPNQYLGSYNVSNCFWNNLN